jgi:uncharacterized protein
MFVGTLKASRALQFVFATVTIMFFMLAIREFIGNPIIFNGVTFNMVTGVEGVVCGFSVIYLAIAEVLTEVYAKTVLPICPVK